MAKRGNALISWSPRLPETRTVSLGAQSTLELGHHKTPGHRQVDLLPCYVILDVFSRYAVG